MDTPISGTGEQDTIGRPTAQLTAGQRTPTRRIRSASISATQGREFPLTHLGRIFEEYATYSGGQDRSGGGLGLAICKMSATAPRACMGREWLARGYFLFCDSSRAQQLVHFG